MFFRSLTCAKSADIAYVDPARVRSAANINDHSGSESSSTPGSPNSELTIEPHHHMDITKLAPTIRTPLLMPPPATTLSTLEHKFSLYRHYIVAWTILNRQTILLVGRLGIFTAKMLSITKPCLPITPRESIWYPLMGLAGLELALGPRFNWRLVLMLTIFHLLVVGGALRWGRLCAPKRSDGVWIWDE